MDNREIIEKIKSKKAFISDMDGVIYHGNKLLPGVPEFVDWLKKEGKKFLFLTNSSERTPKELQEKMSRLGIDLEEHVFYTSALATANFLASQKPRGTAYIIGEAGLINALYNAGYTMNNYNPDYVVVGDTRGYSFEKIEQAVNLVLKGAKLIAQILTSPVRLKVVLFLRPRLLFPRLNLQRGAAHILLESPTL